MKSVSRCSQSTGIFCETDCMLVYVYELLMIFTKYFGEIYFKIAEWSVIIICGERRSPFL